MKKYLAIFSFLILSSTVFASPVGGSIGGWQVVSNVANGIGAKLTATKDVVVNGASKVVTGTANLTPNPGNMARFIGKVGAAAVVTEAMNQVLNGVDYVMDPANNTVTYKKVIEPVFNDGTLSEYVQYQCNGYIKNTVTECGQVVLESGMMGDGASISNCYFTNHPGCTFKLNDGRYYSQHVGTSVPRVDPYPEQKEEKKTVPLSDVASQVITQAEKDIKAGNPASSAVALSRAVAQDMAAEAETDNVKARPIAQQFEQNQSVPTQEDSTGTIDTPEVLDPVTGEVVKPAESASVSLKWPKACEWFPTLCMFIDWMQKPHELDEPNLPTEEIEKKEIDEDLVTVHGSQCPAPISVNIPLPVFNTTYSDSIDITEYCPKIEKLAPVLQLLAFVLAIMIIKDI